IQWFGLDITTASRPNTFYVPLPFALCYPNHFVPLISLQFTQISIEMALKTTGTNNLHNLTLLHDYFFLDTEPRNYFATTPFFIELPRIFSSPKFLCHTSKEKGIEFVVRPQDFGFKQINVLYFRLFYFH